MRRGEITLCCVGVGVAAFLQYYDLLFLMLFLVFLIVICVLGIYLSVSWSLGRGKQYKPLSQPTEPKNVKKLLEQMMEKKSESCREQKKIVVSRNIDHAIGEVMDNVIRDFVLSWYSDLSDDQQTAVDAIKNDAWIVVENLSSRLSKINKVKLITKDFMEIAYKHFNKIRECSLSKGQDQRKFILHAWLAGEDTEVEFLRKLCDALLIVLLPAHYRGCISIRHLLREIITSSVLKPTVDMLCDPDYINRKLIGYIDYRQRLSEVTKKTYTYAATYEDFIKLIDNCNDLEHLKAFRYNILTEIIHATTIDNLKQEQGPGLSSDLASISAGTGKGELLKARNLKRYINQLSVAKNKCEKRLHRLGGPEYKAYDLQSDSIDMCQKVLTFQEVLDSASARAEFEKFLKNADCDSLLGFVGSVDRLRSMEKRLQHHQASEIYQEFINGSRSAVKLEKSIVKGMEAFMLGNQGPESFYEGQQKVIKILEMQHYPSFLVSDIYNRYIRSLEEGSVEIKAESSKDFLLFEPKEQFVDPDEEDEEMLTSQSYEAQARIQQLDEKIETKKQAIKALRESKLVACDDAKDIKIEKDLLEEIENLIHEKRLREAHVLRTRTWIENQGKWSVHVYGAEVVEEQDKKVVVYVLVVYLVGTDAGSQNLQNSTNGWTVSRNLTEFQNLHDSLCQIGPWLKKKDLPSVSRFNMFTSIDEKFIEESKKTLSSYLEVILKDERMANSEALYAFLSPSPEYCKQTKTDSEKGNFLRTFFKKFPSRQIDTQDTDDELLFNKEEESKLDRNVDSIAEPFYRLVNEVFESRGMFKWLRKSFIMFVEVTFGRTINRQLCETVDWVFSESMIVYYIHQFTLSMWPDGKLSEPENSRSDEEKLKTRMEAKEKFLQNMPDAVKTLLGEDNGRRGTIKIFEVLQDTRLNKQLFYELLNLLTLEICPEIRSAKPFVPTDLTEGKS